MTQIENPDDGLLEAITAIAKQAGAVIMTHYAEGEGIEVREKSDSSPVTAADEAAEEVILAALRALAPDIPIVSEEAAAAGHIPDIAGGRFWLVDPLDGTKEFINRNGEFTVNIALIEDGRPVAGVVYAPALDTTWSGLCAAGQAHLAKAGAPAAAIHARSLPEDGAVVVASRRHGSGKELDSFLARYKVADRVSAGSSLKFCLVATGEADIYPRFGRTMEWDTAAGHAVLLAAGGQVFTLEDRPLTYGKPGLDNPYFYAVGAA